MYRLIWYVSQNNYERICLCIAVIIIAFIIFIGEMNINRLCIYMDFIAFISKKKKICYMF